VLGVPCWFEPGNLARRARRTDISAGLADCPRTLHTGVPPLRLSAGWTPSSAAPRQDVQEQDRDDDDRRRDGDDSDGGGGDNHSPPDISPAMTRVNAKQTLRGAARSEAGGFRAHCGSAAPLPLYGFNHAGTDAVCAGPLSLSLRPVEASTIPRTNKPTRTATTTNVVLMSSRVITRLLPSGGGIRGGIHSTSKTALTRMVDPNSWPSRPTSTTAARCLSERRRDSAGSPPGL
jgi:hypothetical protein